MSDPLPENQSFKASLPADYGLRAISTINLHNFFGLRAILYLKIRVLKPTYLRIMVYERSPSST
ncbi:hypothetical protein [Vibrio vulnificus]|uniref:hypothetical protein n=1 Tax=Vibrio vulnificus TaxID=672 RepID=UPI003D9CAF39